MRQDPSRSKQQRFAAAAMVGLLTQRHRLFVLLVVALVISLLGLSLPAQAGNYTVSYSGGSTSSTSGSSPAFSLQGSEWTGTASASGYSSVGVQVNGTITATFTWVPDPALPSDPPPSAAIVTEHCTAEGDGYSSYSQPAVSAADGFGDEATSSSQSQTSIVKTSTGFRSSAQSGASFTVTCSPSVTVSGSMCSLHASVSYSAMATPAVLSLSGVTVVGTDKNILIGQGVTASVDTGGHQQTAWSWTISGDPFAGFVVGPGSATGHAVELAPSTLTQATVPYFYRSIGGNPSINEVHTSSTVTCTVTVVNQNANLPPFQVTVTGTVNVYQPAHTFRGDTGRVGFFAGGTQFGAAGTGPLIPKGSSWTGTVTTPSMFIGEELSGTWNFTQIVKPKMSYTKDGVLQEGPFYNQTGLDSQFPYAGPYTADGTVAKAGDSPYLTLVTGATKEDFLIQGWTSMLYTPPAYDSTSPTTFVPLHKFEWTAVGYITYDAVNGWVAHVIGSGMSSSDTGPTAVLPDWTLLISAN